MQFGKNKKQFRYPMAALRPCVTPEADQLQVKYGELLKATKIRHQERQNLLKSYKETAQITLTTYGFQLGCSINSIEYPELFWKPSIPLEQTPLLFGRGVRDIRGQILNGLSRGGVYRRHDDYRDASRIIRISALKLCDLSVTSFLEDVKPRTASQQNFKQENVKQRLKSYGFN